MKFTTTIVVRGHEVGPDGGLHHGHIARFVLHVGSLVTQALGIDQAWYDAHNTGFVVRGLRLEFESPAREDEPLRLTTWLSEARRVRGLREVVITSERDGRPIANAQLEWVYVDRTSLAPARLPADAMDRIGVDPERACSRSWPAIGADIDVGLAVHAAERRVQKHELDMLRHVNTAVYLEWCEQAWCEATGGQPWDIRGHQLHFQRSARDGDVVRVCSQSAGAGAWRQSVSLAGSGDALVANLCLAGYAP